MTAHSSDLRQILGGTTVGVVFAFLAAVWFLWEYAGLLERLPESLIGLLYPVWLPAYLAILFASGLRNVFLPWLGSGLLFSLAIIFFLYLEAIFLAGLYRSARQIYRRYHDRITNSSPS